MAANGDQKSIPAKLCSLTGETSYIDIVVSISNDAENVTSTHL